MTKQKTIKQRLNHGFLNVFALFVTLMPVVSMALWTHTTFFNDSRQVYELDYLASPEVAPYREPLISVTFDDGWQSVYTDGLPVLEKYQIPSTQYLLTGEDDDVAYLSPEQMTSMHKAGHEIALHGVEHANLPSLNDSALERELAESKKTMQQRQLVGSSTHFASPYNAYDARTIAAISKHYYAHRNTDADLKTVGPEDMNVGPTLKKYQIIGFSVKNTTTDDQLRAALKYAKANNAWFVLVYHQIDTSNGAYAVSPKAFDRQMKIVKESGIKTPTVGSVLGQLEVEGKL